ncbi:MAG: hypothetical protein H6667_18185 [Ardenticatenaceae bacterium]|nr:hypothetical protein [Ardenticatenaceae bacterium]MCB9446559.1 hypothetical protein [Ardenticatenaceae bacterium]
MSKALWQKDQNYTRERATPIKFKIQIGLQRRYDPALLHTKKLLQSSLVGEIREIRCILRDQSPPPETYSSRGLIIDMGIHVADEAIFFLDEFPHEVRASVHQTEAHNSPIDEGGNTAIVAFTTPSNVLGRLDLSRTHSSGYNNETYIIGTKGTIHTGRPIPYHKVNSDHPSCFTIWRNRSPG